MRYKIFIWRFVLLLLQYKCWADGYLAGTARVSIKPDSSVFRFPYPDTVIRERVVLR